MQEGAVTKNSKEAADGTTKQASLAEDVTSALKMDGKFTFYEGMDYRIHEMSHSINKFEFFDKTYRYVDPDESIQKAFILKAVHELGHATKDMLLLWIKWQHRLFPDKLIPACSNDEKQNVRKVTGLLKDLCRNGLLMAHDYVTSSKDVIVVYTCTYYGHIFYRNKLEVYAEFDTNSMFRTEADVFMHMAVNAIAIQFQKCESCTGIYLNGKYGLGDYTPKTGYVYAVVEFNKGQPDAQLFLIEPVFFRVNKKIATEQEHEEKVIARLNQVKKLVAGLQSSAQLPVRVLYVVENMHGISRMKGFMTGNMMEPIFQYSLLTSENVIYRTRGNLSESFLKFEEKEDGSLKLVLARDTWLIP